MGVTPLATTLVTILVTILVRPGVALLAVILQPLP